MSSDIAISVESLSKCYQLYEKPRDRLLQMLFRGSRQYYKEFWALDGVSFNIKKGETVGILGRNGSGKSTLLQIICGTLSATNGRVNTNGRIAALLELGSGFNPEFTGRENVYMSASILGLNKHEIDSRFDEIAAFADIGDFIEQPLLTYSSGMYVRLAFAVNIVSEPDIMIVDEALAVGDMKFQAKCMTALTRIQDRGATVLFVSHDVGAVKSLCSRGVYLEAGKVIACGKAPDVAELYMRSMREEMNAEVSSATYTTKTDGLSTKVSSNETPIFSENVVFKRSEEFDKRVTAFRYGSGDAKITFVELLDERGEPLINVEFNQIIQVVIYFETDIEAELSCNYYIADQKKNLVIGSGLRQSGEKFLKSKENGKYVITYTTKVPLQEGNYSIQVQLSRPMIVNQTAEFLDVVDDAVVFQVSRNPEARIWSQLYLHNSVKVLEA